MNSLKSTAMWLAGVQWLFFMFANTVVIPITIGHAFDLSAAETASALQLSFIFTGVACILQVLIGHKYPIMEGQAGLWWGAILSIAASASAAGYTLTEVGGSLSLGIILSGILVATLGLLGIGKILDRMFTPVVMSAVMFLLASQLILIFVKGMFGITENGGINMPVAALSVFLVILVAFLTIKGPGLISNFSILIGIVIGWILFAFFFDTEPQAEAGSGNLFMLFPWGELHFNSGIVLFAVLAGLVNTTNTMASVKGVASLLKKNPDEGTYRRAFLLTGANSVFAGLFGLVPYAPYISSIGFLQSTRIMNRAPLLIGGGLFAILGLVPPLGSFFSTLPASVGNAVLFVAYLQLFSGAVRNLEGIELSHKTIYRIAAPVLFGIALMNIPASAFSTIPMMIRPLVSNGMLMGILLAILLENTVRWDKFDR